MRNANQNTAKIAQDHSHAFNPTTCKDAKEHLTFIGLQQRFHSNNLCFTINLFNNYGYKQVECA